MDTPEQPLRPKPADLTIPSRRWFRRAVAWMVPGPHAADQPPLFAVPPTPPDGEERIGICCSGGGLRSASFSLGGLQVLWGLGILQRARFLAGVSGGSYAVTAATVLRHKSTEAFEDANAPGPYALGSPELDYLRNRTDYLAPRLSGKWNLVFRFIIGVALNVFTIFAAAFLLGELLGFLYGRAYPSLRDGGEHVSFGWVAWTVALLPAAIGLVAQLVDLLFRPAGDQMWRRLVRWSGTLMALSVVLLVAVIGLPALLAWLRRVDVSFTSAANGVAGVRATVLGALATIAGVGLHVATSGGAKLAQQASTRLRALPRAISKVVSALLIGLVAPLALLVTLMIGVDAPTNGWSRDDTIATIVIVVLLALVGWLGNPIAWSAQPFYRRRLRTVFSLQRVVQEDGVQVQEITYDDEPPISALGRIVHETDPSRNWPELLICATANASNLGLTPPKLAVFGFVFSPTEIGGHLTGYFPMKDYEDAIRHRRWFQTKRSTGTLRDVSPLAAVSISGAAISPTMGRMTRPAYRMLLTMFNLRLGVWLPNPNRVRREQWKRRWRVYPHYLIREMFGWNSIFRRFLYVTDGGHFENLGLVELLRRGCTEIWCLDAAGDAPGQLRTLGQAFAVARAELGVEFDAVDPSHFARPSNGTDGMEANCDMDIGFRYLGGRAGVLHYLRKSLTPDAPLDLLAYHTARTIFPNDGTGDQFFDAEQFEAYRRLGVYVATVATGAAAHPASPASERLRG